MKTENPSQFETRKQDHVRIAMDPKVQTKSLSKLDHISLIHEALPELNFQEIDIRANPFGLQLSSPLFISSMTAGHTQGREINLILAQAAQECGWMMGVGSQRKELDPVVANESKNEWQAIRKKAPRAKLFGNLGLSQLIHTPVEQVLRLIENLEAVGFFIHTNPLQEALQPEGTPHFAGGLKALAELTEAVAKNFQIPVVLKEVGCGFSAGTLQKLQGLGLAAVDVSGLGGTHWGRVETGRTTDTQMRLVGQTYSNWGLSTLDSLAYAKDLADRGLISYQVWASGGVRTGLDAAKLLAMGSEMVGLAQPLLQGALAEIQTKNPSLVPLMRRLDKELKIALFCTGCENISTFRKKGVWKHD